eukprot:scaffold3079_cov119-Cylindrotheca_fusiformis.AAC.22
MDLRFIVTVQGDLIDISLVGGSIVVRHLPSDFCGSSSLRGNKLDWPRRGDGLEVVGKHFSSCCPALSSFAKHVLAHSYRIVAAIKPFRALASSYRYKLPDGSSIPLLSGQRSQSGNV